jgi:hypothetical protein
MRYRLAMLLFLYAVRTAAQETVTVIVPIVGNLPGVNTARWMTDVELTNASRLASDVALELPAAPGAPLMILTLGPGQTQRFTDVVGQAFGLDTVLSPLRVTFAANHNLVVRASAYALREEGISALQPIAVYAENSWYPVRVLDGLAFSDAWRTNVGLVNFGESAADVLFALQKIPGRNVATTPMRIPAGAVMHVPIQAIFPLITEGAGFSVLVETASRDTHVYASVISNETNAGQFIAARIGTR